MLEKKRQKYPIKYKASKLHIISLPSLAFFSFSFHFFFFWILLFQALFYKPYFIVRSINVMASLSPIVHLFKKTGLKKLFLLHKKIPNASQKLRWCRQKLVYLNNQKSVGHTDGIFACYIKLYKVTTYMTTYGHHIFVGHLTFH